MPRAEPRSRRERPAKPPLSREVIVDAAVRVLESDGIGRLTMRRLAQEVDAGPASLYVYVRSTTEVHALLIDRLLATLDLTWDGRGDWRQRLRALLTDYGNLLMAHPGLADSALVTWPQGTNYLDLVELLLRLLDAGGASPARAAWGVDVLLQQATAMAAEYGGRGRPAGGQGDVADLVAALDDASPQRHPLLTTIGAEQMVGGERDERRAWAMDVTVSGIFATPVPGEQTHPAI
ncbi:TetR/AcrR family transcriptional regulator [Actinotalea subterranea]|uniref:TetR/AcrR family transcriptional regulator n=1 Tax=Actinotalea subterranea TaxID=2607497 RepID=UPI0011EBDBE4|nr:TetR/AcrR family transcriptional regulator [Actinotalea subterranea]